MKEILISVNGELQLLTEKQYDTFIKKEVVFILIGRIDTRLNKHKLSDQQERLILKEVEQNMKYFNNLPFGEIHNNLKTVIKNLK